MKTLNDTNFKLRTIAIEPINSYSFWWHNDICQPYLRFHCISIHICYHLPNTRNLRDDSSLVNPNPHPVATEFTSNYRSNLDDDSFDGRILTLDRRHRRLSLHSHQLRPRALPCVLSHEKHSSASQSYRNKHEHASLSRTCALLHLSRILACLVMSSSPNVIFIGLVLGVQL